jgi:hypothetical protein
MLPSKSALFLLPSVCGMLRALELLNRIKKLGWKIIIGCHVGETSLLTRASLIAALLSGGNLIGQEGAFGEYLLKTDPVSPLLQFKQGGTLCLDQPYLYQSAQHESLVSPNNWKRGFWVVVSCSINTIDYCFMSDFQRFFSHI